ncbi:MAG: 30S ribosomal protein S6 [Bdellovibrionota bacterium]
MRKYETIVIFKSDVTKEYLNTVSKKLEKAMKAKPGQLEKKDDWGIKKFAYPIQKLAEGRYVFWYFENEPAALKEIDKALRFDENVLRYSTLTAIEPVKGTTGDNKKTLRTSGGKRVHVDYKEPVTLTKYLTERGKIVPRRVSGVDARTQKRISQAVKRARQIALLSHTEGIFMPYEKSEKKYAERKSS